MHFSRNSSALVAQVVTTVNAGRNTLGVFSSLQLISMVPNQIPRLRHLPSLGQGITTQATPHERDNTARPTADLADTGNSPGSNHDAVDSLRLRGGKRDHKQNHLARSCWARLLGCRLRRLERVRVKIRNAG